MTVSSSGPDLDPSVGITDQHPLGGAEEQAGIDHAGHGEDGGLECASRRAVRQRCARGAVERQVAVVGVERCAVGAGTDGGRESERA